MTPRERWLALLDGRTPDRIPTDYWATPEFDRLLKQETGCPDDESLCRRLDLDCPCRVEPTCRLPHHPHDPAADIWGIRYRWLYYGSGQYEEAIHYPLAQVESVSEVHAFRWPQPDDFDYTSIGRAIDINNGYRPVAGWAYEPFLLYCRLRGPEQSFIDLVENPDIADAILGHIFDVYFERNRRMFEAGGRKIDVFILGEDLGSQTGPLISLAHYRRFLLPNQIRMADLARSWGSHIFYHTDGAARIFLPDLIDQVGIEILNPIQWRCPGMERESLVRDFGGKVIFHGAVDNQHTLPFGTPDEVVREVRDNREIFRDARWICAPCHNIQPNTPVSNVVAMYRTIHEEVS